MSIGIMCRIPGLPNHWSCDLGKLSSLSGSSVSLSVKVGKQCTPDRLFLQGDDANKVLQSCSIYYSSPTNAITKAQGHLNHALWPPSPAPPPHHESPLVLSSADGRGTGKPVEAMEATRDQRNGSHSSLANSEERIWSP